MPAVLRELVEYLFLRVSSRCQKGPDFLRFARTNKLITACSYLQKPVSEEFHEALLRQADLRINVIESLKRIHSVLTEVGVRYAVIKGFSFEKAIYGDSPLRDVGDIDLLINPQDAQRAHEGLCALGYKQQLGPSSGSLDRIGRARFAKRVAQQEYVNVDIPERRFPYKDAFCPYVRFDSATVELHFGFRGLPCWCTSSVVERASENTLSLMEDEIDIFVFLIANTYENAESFYSNYFDGKMVMRDFVDLACFLKKNENSLDWQKARHLLSILGIEEKAGCVLSDAEELLSLDAAGAELEVEKAQSPWNAVLWDRLMDGGFRAKSVRTVIRSELKNLSKKALIGWDASSEAADGFTATCNAARTPSLRFSKVADGLVLKVDGLVGRQDGSFLIVFRVFPVTGRSVPLSRQISILYSEGTPVAFLSDFDKLSDGFSVWSESGEMLDSRYADGILEVVVPGATAELIFRENETAITAGIYRRHYGDVFWAECRGKEELSGSVPIGRLFLYSGENTSTAYIEFSFARCIVSSNKGDALSFLLKTFEGARIGAPLDCDILPDRNYVMRLKRSGTYDVEVNGVLLKGELSLAAARSCLMQDISDWIVATFIGNASALHAASNAVADGVVLCMGNSGCGKTTLSLALAQYWPLRNDECAFVDFEQGEAWSERTPLNIKEGNMFALKPVGLNEGICCESLAGKKQYYFSRAIVRADAEPEQRTRIRAIVFPEYDPSVSSPKMKRPPYDVLVPSILESLVGTEAPSILLQSFLRMVSLHKIELLAIRFSDADQAAKAVVERLDIGGFQDEI